jgi:hypothetical protein
MTLHPLQAAYNYSICCLPNIAAEGKAIPVTGREGPWRPFTARKIPGTHFCQRLNRPYGHSAVGRIRSIGKSYDFIGNRTRDLPVCSIVPQPTMLEG